MSNLGPPRTSAYCPYPPLSCKLSSKTNLAPRSSSLSRQQSLWSTYSQSLYSEGDVCVFRGETPLPNCLHIVHISHMNCCLAKNGQAAVYEPCCILPNGAHPDPAGWGVILAPPLLSGRRWQMKSVAGAPPRFSSKGIFLSIFQPVTSAPQLCHRTIFQEIICSKCTFTALTLTLGRSIPAYKWDLTMGNRFEASWFALEHVPSSILW